MDRSGVISLLLLLAMESLVQSLVVQSYFVVVLKV
jgi:hypothetical protein